MSQEILTMFGCRLRQLRASRGMSQEELGALAGLDRTYIILPFQMVVLLTEHGCHHFMIKHLITCNGAGEQWFARFFRLPAQ
ncbi:helix-turn-helix domain-containing protein [Zhongshania sp.]|uniref:helix-turn-helix domain-containing protein n=1 Tax=Zhongshania sp. TaxID=1971902 RepID=UPI00356836DD